MQVCSTSLQDMVVPALFKQSCCGGWSEIGFVSDPSGCQSGGLGIGRVIELLDLTVNCPYQHVQYDTISHLNMLSSRIKRLYMHTCNLQLQEFETN